MHLFIYNLDSGNNICVRIVWLNRMFQQSLVMLVLQHILYNAHKKYIFTHLNYIAYRVKQPGACVCLFVSTRVLSLVMRVCVFM